MKDEGSAVNACFIPYLSSLNPHLSRRWSQTARRLPAKQLQVGSTPTGASDTARPTAHVAPSSDEAVGGVCSVHGF